jgi:hypothetical protein
MNGKVTVRTVAARVVFGAALCVLASGQARAQTPTQVSPEEFAALSWLEGRWVGSGGGGDAFYESYRFVNEGTIEQTSYPDATFTTPSSRSTIEHRGGFVMKSTDGTVQSVVTRLDDEEIRFEWADRGRPGFTWTRISDEEWVAVLEQKGQAPIVYNLRRVSAGG